MNCDIMLVSYSSTRNSVYQICTNHDTQLSLYPATRPASDDNHLGTATTSLIKKSYFQEKKTRSCVKTCFVQRHKKNYGIFVNMLIIRIYLGNDVKWFFLFCALTNKYTIISQIITLLQVSTLSCLCTMTNKCTIISQIIALLHVSTLSCHPQGTCNQYLAKLHKHFKCNCR